MRKCRECDLGQMPGDRPRPKCRDCSRIPPKLQKLQALAQMRSRAKHRDQSDAALGEKKSDGADPGSETADLAILPASSPTPSPSTWRFTDPTTTIFEGVEYYNVNICPDLVIENRFSKENNPFYVGEHKTGSIRPAVSELLISAALGHRILQSAERPRLETAILTERLYYHRMRATRMLSEDLAGSAGYISDGTINLVLTILLIEIQQSPSPVWTFHVEGAWAVIQARQGIGAVMYSAPKLCYLLRYFVLVDVFGATTAPVIKESSAQRQMDLLEFIPALFGDGLQTRISCPQQLIGYVIRVTNLRCQLQGQHIDRDHVLYREAVGLLHEILSLPLSEWAELAASASLPADTDSLFGGCTDNSDGWTWLACATAFRSSTALYCMLSLFRGDHNFDRTKLPDGFASFVSVAGATEMCRGVLMGNLRMLATQKFHLRHFVTWPLVIIGLAIPARERHVLEPRIVRQLKHISAQVGLAPPLAGIEFLQRYWSRGRDWSGSGYMSWEGLFDKPYIFL